MSLSMPTGTSSVLTISLLLAIALSPILFSSSRWLGVGLIFGSQTLAYYVWKILIFPFYLHPLRNEPHPANNHPLMGQLFNILQTRGELPALVARWTSSLENDGLIVYRGMYNAWRVILTSPDNLRELLVTHAYDTIKPPALAAGLVETLGSGLLTSEGIVHKRQRKLFSPAFAYRHVQDLFPTFWNATRLSVEVLDKEIGRRSDGVFVTTIDDWSTRLTLDIIGLAAIGRSFDAVEDPEGELCTIYKGFFQATPSSILRLIKLAFPVAIVKRLPITSIVRQNKARHEIRQVCKRLIEEKRSKLEMDEKPESFHSTRDVDILSVALRSGGFTPSELIDHMMTFFAAGHETTASAVTWAIYALCCHPQVQSTLRNKLAEAGLSNIRDAASGIIADDVARIPYLRAVISEVLRFYPPVPMTARQTTKDIIIGGKLIPKDTVISLLPVAINHHKAFWGEDADKFVPERWLDEQGEMAKMSHNAHANLTFLHGARGCIGQNFSKAEFSCILAGWVQSYEFELAEPEKELEIEANITQKPKGGLPVRIRRADV